MPYPRTHERRYPATPYAPRSESTRTYRDYWDRGWRDFATRPGWQVLDLERGLSGPARRGYRDGVTARWVRLQQEEAFDRAMVRQEQAQLREERRRWGSQERPY